MNQKTAIKHIGIHYNDRESARIFFKDILGLEFKKTFSLSSELSNEIFGISENISIDVYENDNSYFEVFITKNSTKNRYEHICLEIESKNQLIDKCKEHGLEPIIVNKNGKTLLFIKDFSGNLYEIKQRI
jgi:catechol 2,3-dioxygenase-like lactoylglutathione lyase family enzyme